VGCSNVRKEKTVFCSFVPTLKSSKRSRNTHKLSTDHDNSGKQGGGWARKKKRQFLALAETICRLITILQANKGKGGGDARDIVLLFLRHFEKGKERQQHTQIADCY